MRFRLSFARVAALIVLAVLFAPPLLVDSAAAQSDAPLSTPTGLVARAYSETAGGIRWERSSSDGAAVRGYEIVRDGVELGIFDALSRVDDDLEAGTAYRYTVTAIGRDGQRSGAASVTLLTEGRGPDTGTAPTAPEGLRSAVYSQTAAEIFWTRPDTFGLVYEISRDGAVIATTDGTSYFDPALVGGTSYEYGVVAIDRQGFRSTPSIVTLATHPGEGAAPPSGIDRENFAGILALTARLVTDTFDAGVWNFLHIAREDSGTADREGIFGFDAEGFPVESGSIVSRCPRSGTVTIVQGGLSIFGYDDAYDDCDTPRSTINGTAVDDGRSAAFAEVDLVFDNLRFDRFAPDVANSTGTVVVRGSAYDPCTECTGNSDYTLHEYREEAGAGTDRIDFSLTGSGFAGGDFLGVDAAPFEDDITLFSTASYHVVLSAYPGIAEAGTEPLTLDVEITIDVEGFGVPGSRIDVVEADGSAVRARFQGLVGVPDVELEDAAGNRTFERLDWFGIFPFPLGRTVRP